MYQVTFTDQGSIAVEPGSTILEAAQLLSISLSAPCGGHGKCGKCRVIANGQEVLACAYKVFEDITVFIPQQDKQQILTSGITAPIQLDPLYAGYLIAIDIGTTTVVCSLLSPAGQELAVESMGNPQSSYGADVVSRIQCACSGEMENLTRMIRQTLAKLTVDMCSRAHTCPEEIGTVAVVGNPAMQ